MFGIAATSGRFERRTARRLSTWTRDYLRKVALADFGCAVAGVFVAAQARFGNNVTPTYLALSLALSLALPVLWIGALWLAGAYDVRFIGTGSDEYRKVLNAGASLTAAGACVAWPGDRDEVAGVPVYGGLDDDITAAIKAFGADTVAVLASPEMDGFRLRSLAWELEKTGTDLCVAPSLLDIAGPRTTVRPTAGLTLLHVDHPQLDGFRLVLKGLSDPSAAAAALIMLAPVMAVLAAAIWLHDRGPAYSRR